MLRAHVRSSHQADDGHARGNACRHPRCTILDDDAVGRFATHTLRSMQKDVGMRFASGDSRCAENLPSEVVVQFEHVETYGQAIGRGGGCDAPWQMRKCIEMLAGAFDETQLPAEPLERPCLELGR